MQPLLHTAVKKALGFSSTSLPTKNTKHINPNTHEFYFHWISRNK